ncbi:hypothetical protein IT400_03145 [Candidatus Nomurabacteria bacterium]|nr:hypothetical protein [Candidatus Nomurabacteria bacterium]
MTNFVQADIFFFISSIGFIIFGILFIVLLYKIIKIADTLSRITKKVENGIDTIGDTTKEVIEDMKDSLLFRFLFKGRKKKTKKVKVD